MLVLDKAFNAFLQREEAPVAHAPSGPLSGLTLAVKDIYDVAGWRTGGGNPARLAQAPVAAASAPVVQRLLDAGARFAGKTQTDELAFSLFGVNAHFPRPVNPAAPGRITGGSSSGSAAAVAGGLADIALGSDTGGSIRAPASFCGLIGLRVTHGSLPLDGVMPLASSFDTAGWFARDVETYERVADVLLGPPPSPLWGGSAHSAGVGARDTPLAARPFHLAALDELVLGPSEAAAYHAAVGIAASALGASVEQRPLTHAVEDLYWGFRKLQSFEAWREHGPWISAADRKLGAGVKERFEFGRTMDATTAAAETARRDAFRAELADRLGEDGILVLPTVPGAAPRTDAPETTLQSYRERALKSLCWSGLSGFPQITLPLGSVDGAPFGLALLGPAGSDRRLLALGLAIMATAGEA